MRLISTKECKPGMRLGKPIYSKNGQTLVNYHMQLNEKLIERLTSMGYEYLYIDDPQTEGIYIEDSIRMETRIALRMSLERILSTVESNPNAIIDGRVSISHICWESITMVVNDLRDPRDDTIMLIHASTPHSELSIGHFMQNAIDVCVYATKIGMTQGYYGKDLIAFSLGALLHDIGNLRISREILQKPSSLTRSEYDHIKQHCELGYEMLKNEPGIPQSVALCALMHHERADGSGYPYGLKSSEIHPDARWIGLIDTYDALTNPRSYRKAMLPHEAMEVLYANAGILYDYDKVELFRKKLAIFPVGLRVLLNTGESGIVSKVNPGCIQRPIIRVLYDRTGVELQHPYEIDLSRKLHIMIERIGENATI